MAGFCFFVGALWGRVVGEGNGHALYILAWKITRTEEPGGLHVRHN